MNITQKKKKVQFFGRLDAAANLFCRNIEFSKSRNIERRRIEITITTILIFGGGVKKATSRRRRDKNDKTCQKKSDF